MLDKEIDIVVLNMPILDTRKYKELEGIGQLVSDCQVKVLRLRNKREFIKVAQKISCRCNRSSKKLSMMKLSGY